MEGSQTEVIRQHLIDPEICIRCNTCELTCPVGAITHDARNYVVDANICNLCMACVPPCPTGSIDNWRAMPRSRAYSVEAQFEWDALPAELSADELGAAGASAAALAEAAPQSAPERSRRGSRVRGQRLRRRDPALVGRQSLRQPLWSEGRDAIGHGHRRRQCSGHRSRQGLRHPSHRARFRRDAVSGARRAVDWDHSSRRRRGRQSRTIRGNIRSRAPATASDPATTTSRSP